VFNLGRPVLGICYGMQLMAHTLGGRVAPAPQREFRHAGVTVASRGASAVLFEEVPPEIRVWASHGDLVASAPAGFEVVATSANAPVAAMADPSRQLYALLFDPEVVHTESGLEILRNFAYSVCGCTGDWTMSSFVEEATAKIREKVGAGRVVCALSGGGRFNRRGRHPASRDWQSTDLHLRRQRRVASRRSDPKIRRRFERLSLPLVFVDASDMFLDRLAGVTDPERKRKIIGATFIDVFESEAAKLRRSTIWRRGRCIRT
jgi:GMP synthase (glutamine-hydrolysing)